MQILLLIRYRSYYYDAEIGLYYLNFRYYNSAWGRFINADGIIGANSDILGYNLYAYCSNNPIAAVDFDGKFSLKSFVKVAMKSIKNAFTYMLDYIKDNALNGTTKSYEYSLGNVYIVKPNQENEYRNKINSNDILIIDRRTGSNSDMVIIDSYKIGLLENQNRIIDIMYEYNDSYPSEYPWKRSRKTMLREWDAHTTAYYVFNAWPEHTKDVNFDNRDENSIFYNNVAYDIFDYFFGWAF